MNICLLLFTVWFRGINPPVMPKTVKVAGSNTFIEVNELCNNISPSVANKKCSVIHKMIFIFDGPIGISDIM